jgi:MFS family permease
MAAALMLPRVLERTGDRPVMLAGAAVLAVLALFMGAALWLGRGPGWAAFLALWTLIGLAYAAILTPAGRLLRRSAHAEDRPALFAAQFALSHVCWLIAYPLAGQAGAIGSMALAFAATAVLAAIGTITAFKNWPVEDPEVVEHSHSDLPPGHPHLVEGHPGGSASHAFVIDELHPHWTIR